MLRTFTFKDIYVLIRLVKKLLFFVCREVDVSCSMFKCQ